MAKKWAILIGINDYSYLQPLRFAKADAEACKQSLEESLGFDRLFLFTDDSPPISSTSPILTTPTFGHLDTFFDMQFKQQLLKPEDSLWFFFAGHGMRNNNGDYLMLADSNPQRIDRTSLSLGYITERLRKWGAGNVVMFIDACRNENSGDRSDDLSAVNHQGIITFYSCGIKQKSYEIDKLGHGSFSYVLLQAFKQHQQNCFTVGKLEQYLMEQVPIFNSDHGKPIQNPLARVEPTERKEAILFGKPQTQDIEILKLRAFRKEHESPEEALKLWRMILKYDPDDPEVMPSIERICSNRKEPPEKEKSVFRSFHQRNQYSDEGDSLIVSKPSKKINLFNQIIHETIDVFSQDYGSRKGDITSQASNLTNLAKFSKKRNTRKDEIKFLSSLVFLIISLFTSVYIGQFFKNSSTNLNLTDAEYREYESLTISSTLPSGKTLEDLPDGRYLYADTFFPPPGDLTNIKEKKSDNAYLLFEKAEHRIIGEIIFGYHAYQCMEGEISGNKIVNIFSVSISDPDTTSEIIKIEDVDLNQSFQYINLTSPLLQKYLEQSQKKWSDQLGYCRKLLGQSS